jgi:hypothetical protein
MNTEQQLSSMGGPPISEIPPGEGWAEWNQRRDSLERRMMAMGLLPYEPTLDEYLWGGAPAPSTNTMHDWILGWTAAYNAQLTQTLIALQGVLAELPAPTTTLMPGVMLASNEGLPSAWWEMFWTGLTGAAGGAGDVADIGDMLLESGQAFCKSVSRRPFLQHERVA